MTAPPHERPYEFIDLLKPSMLAKENWSYLFRCNNPTNFGTSPEVLVDHAQECGPAVWSGTPCHWSSSPRCNFHAHLPHLPPTYRDGGSFGTIAPAKQASWRTNHQRSNQRKTQHDTLTQLAKLSIKARLVALKAVASHQQSKEGQTREHYGRNLSDFAPLHLRSWTTKTSELLWN